MTLEEISNRPQNVEALKAILANPRAKEDYYLDYLMSCKTGQYILTTKAKFRGLQNGDVITEFSTRFKLYIKKSAVEVHELHTRTMAIHDYNVTFE